MIKKTACWQRDGFTLRSFRKGEAEKYYQDCFTKTCEEVYYLTGTTQTFSRDDIIRYHNRVVSSSERFDFILVAPDGRFIGEAVVNEVDTLDQSANFRIVIFDKAYWNQGLGSWMTTSVCDFVFGTVGLHRLELEVYSFNPRAQAAYEKAGFKLEGRKRESIKTKNGYADTLIMALLDKEWKALKSNKEAFYEEVS